MSDGLLAETPAEKEFFESGGEKSPGQEPVPSVEKTEDAQEGGQRESQAEKPEAEAKQTPNETRVSYGALHQERRRRQQLEAELAEFRKFKEAIEAEKAKPQIPARDADPVGHFDARQGMAEQQLAELRERQAKADEAAQRQDAENRFRVQVVSSEREFVKTQADYFEAMEYLRGQRDQELQMIGISDPAQRQQMMNNEAMGIAFNAMQNGENPAKRAYEIARFRGFKAKPKAAEQIETLQKGAEAARSLSGKGGQSPAAVSPEALLEMSDEDFDKQFEKVMRGKK